MKLSTVNFQTYANGRLPLSAAIKNVKTNDTYEGKIAPTLQHGFVIEKSDGSSVQPFGEGWMFWFDGKWHEVANA